jgi:hypothetical protein
MCMERGRATLGSSSLASTIASFAFWAAIVFFLMGSTFLQRWSERTVSELYVYRNHNDRPNDRRQRIAILE